MSSQIVQVVHFFWSIDTDFVTVECARQVTHMYDFHRQLQLAAIGRPAWSITGRQKYTFESQLEVYVVEYRQPCILNYCNLVLVLLGLSELTLKSPEDVMG